MSPIFAFLAFCPMLVLSAPEAQPCCTEKSFEAVLGEIGGIYINNVSQSLPVDGWIHLSYDYPKKKMAMRVHEKLPDGATNTVTVLVDYGKQREYTIEGSRCSVRAMDEMMKEPCVPANATYLGASYFGYGSDKVEFVTWKFQGPHQLEVKLTVTKHECVPVTEAMHGTVKGVQTAISYSFANFTPGIADESILEIPDICKKDMKLDTTSRHQVTAGRMGGFVTR